MNESVVLTQMVTAIEKMLQEDKVTGTPEERSRLSRELVAAKGACALAGAREKLAALNSLYTDFSNMVARDMPSSQIREVEALLLESASYFGEYAMLLAKVENKS